MAKSTRSKVKRSYRAKKRETGVYAAAEAARLQRLSSKLKTIIEADKHDGVEVRDDQKLGGIATDASPGAAQSEGANPSPDVMELDDSTVQSAKKISTHGRRMSRREEWRLSKGMSMRPKLRGTNRHSGNAAKRKSGKPHRRR